MIKSSVGCFGRPAQAQIFEIAAMDFQPLSLALRPHILRRGPNFLFVPLRTNCPTNHGYNLMRGRLIAWKWAHCQTTRTTLSISVCQGPMQEAILTLSPSPPPLRLVHRELQN